MSCVCLRVTGWTEASPTCGRCADLKDGWWPTSVPEAPPRRLSRRRLGRTTKAADRMDWEWSFSSVQSECGSIHRATAACQEIVVHLHCQPRSYAYRSVRLMRACDAP